MKISYCTTCHNRLWQLKQTIEHNLSFTKKDEVELCILAYNDDEVEPYLKVNYGEYIHDGRLKVHSVKSPLPYTCGRVKNMSHVMGKGEILFNLDADNFICNAHAYMLALKPGQIFKGIVKTMTGESGRIGVYARLYRQVGGYHDVGRGDDGDFVARCLRAGVRLLQVPCEIPPIANEPPEDNTSENVQIEEKL